ncbi:MAG: aminotransferase class I/II-fold pyridoxal phosphate-dependent enzyme [Candidatus Omnitrophica bacterium]|nr:aminotransferase class I/II-fold pyridoxal phosphate-dependent enzyme [Candidatus Omnitrophota bacterium]
MTPKIFTIESPERLKQLPPYLFAEVDRRKRELIAQGKDVVDLGVGDPDLPTPDFIIEALLEGVKNPANHRYALDAGMPEFRKSIQQWFQTRFGYTADLNTEILPLLGSKEGIAHLPLALINPGDVALIPDPGYPVYRSGTLFAGGVPYVMPLLEANGFLPDLGAIPDDVLKKARIMFINYPNNPTSAVATKEFYQEVVDFARKNDIMIISDAAYSEVVYDGYTAPSILQIPGAKEVAVELHSLSKTFNMTGWRVGFAIGNPDIIKLLAKVKSNCDSGIFGAVQWAAKRALDDGHDWCKKNLLIYQTRRDLFVSGMKNMGWSIEAPKATFYCWIPVPPGSTSAELCLRFLTDLNIVVTPGNGFGPNGEGYFRVSLTYPDHRIEEALKRIASTHKHPHK